jgi:hypothetical protein
MCEKTCSKCGFLAVREYRSRRIAEVEGRMRADWKTSNLPVIVEKEIFYESPPFCFLGYSGFEISVNANQADIKRVIELDRSQCPSFREWLPGRTPVEHHEMKLSLQEDQKRREWEQETRQKDREFQLEQRRTDLAFQLEQKKAANEREDKRDADNRAWQDSWNRWNRGWQIVLALIAALGVGSWIKSLIDRPAKMLPNQDKSIVAPASHR